MTLERIRDALEARGCRPRPSGDGLKALCPVCQLDGHRHDPGLSVKAGDSQEAVAYCHGPGRCEYRTILDALNLEHEAAKRKRSGRPKPSPAARLDPDAEAAAWRFAEALWEPRNAEALEYLERERGLPRAVILAARLGHDGERFTIPIFNAAGEVLFIRRYLPGADGKGEDKFKQPSGVKAQLYGAETLGGLEDGELVLACEGELDRLRALSLGYKAVTGTAGAKAWRDEWSKVLRRFDCVVLGDHDADGREMNRKATDSLRKAGAYAQAVEWPDGTPEKADVSDYVREHGAEAFAELVGAALAAGELKRLDLGSMFTEDLEPVPWTLEPWLAERDVVALAGEPKTGKSWLALALAVDLARGGSWLGIESGRPRRVLYVDEENNPRLIRYRLRKLAHGLGLGAEEFSRLPLRYLSENGLNLDRDDRLQAFFREVRRYRPKWTVLDSLVRFHGRDENSNSAMAAFAAEVIKPLVAHYGTGVLFLHHLSKPSKERSGGAVARVRGASDLVALVDQLWLLERDHDAGRLTLRHELSRWAETAGALTVTLEDTEDAQGVTLTATEAETGTEAAILEALGNAGSDGLARKAVLEVLKDEGVAGDSADRVASRQLGRLHAEGRVKKAGNNRGMTYYLAELAPPEAA